MRHAVSVMNLDGVEREYASVRAAFEALHLPLAKHVRFRLALKDAGALSFEHRNEVYAFRLVARR
ncbi:hypothetical protein [Trinickia sp.]|uniref:hypothetical protein n=1 Tax=Trinickia sp. TaxID=2571163 RepID=UPI003F806884